MSETASQPLLNRVIALPETRQLDVLAQLLERRGATPLRCPLVAILDAPDPVPVENWLRALIEQPPDLLILLTGEGLRRLLGFAERAGLRDGFVSALSRVRKLARGPKPGRALREIGLNSDLVAAQPTTEGVIETLSTLPLAGKRVGVQLYGEEPNHRLIDFLRGRGGEPQTVAPYIYASKEDDEKVVALIDRILAGEVDAIAFTSQPQYKRLVAVARTSGKDSELASGLAKIKVAAVGPVVRDQLEAAGVRVDAMPEDSFFMKPLVNEMVRLLA